LSAAALTHDDPRFRWNAYFGGDFDLIDYVYGRLTVTVDYQTIVGNEVAPFDPVQGKYNLATAVTMRTGRMETVVEFHHVSRHLSDREKHESVAWNQIDARLLRRFDLGQSVLDLRVEAGKVVAKAYVDYSWSAELEGRLRRRLSPRVSVFGRGAGETIGVTPTYERSQQYGGRLEGGVRFDGDGSALELFGGYERVIDADPFDLQTRNWAYGGFRLVTD
jgi:hypothetical protein